jgi:hypothetical protein
MTPSGFTPPLVPFSNELSLLDFKTQEAWTAYDLGRALAALDSLYLSLLLARHLAVIANQRLRGSEEQFGRYLEALEREGPHFDMLFHEWSRFLRRYGPAAAQFLSPFGPAQMQVVDHLDRVLPPAEINYYISNTSEFLSSAHELKIRKIAISSPGGFSLEGLGEPLRELREFIKDMCYRNRQEREKGNLEILKQKLDIISQHNLSPLHIQIIATSAIRDAEEVAELLQDGHLQLEDSDSTPSEKQGGTKKAKRKRQSWKL